MPSINLLPWREELRARRNKEFGALAAVVAAALLGIVAAVHVGVQSRIDYQQARNDYLSGEISKLNRQIAEIKDLQNERERLIARSDKIQQLQSGRPEIVHLMDALVGALPPGTYYTGITQQQSQLSITGKAQSNARVSSLMRNLEASPWLESPLLRGITAEVIPGQTDLRMSRFELSVGQTAPRAGTDEDGGSS